MSEPQVSKEKLIKTAIELFSARGFRGTSIRDIAQAMGMSISNIYHYFGNKEGLLLAILEHSSKTLVEKLHEVAGQDSDPLDRFKELVVTHMWLSGSYKKEARIFFLDEEHLSEEGSVVNRQIQKDILLIYRNQLRALQDAGYLGERNKYHLGLQYPRRDQLAVALVSSRWSAHDGSSYRRGPILHPPRGFRPQSVRGD